MQFERGENGTRHLKCFILFRTKRRFGTARRIFGDDENPHIESCRDVRKSEVYCRKEKMREGAFLTNCREEDTRAMGQGRRTDLSKACEAIMSGTRIRDVAREWPTQFVRYSRGLEELPQTIQPRRDSKTFVLWLYGRTGCEKSRAARDLSEQFYENAGMCYERTRGSKWWDGYENKGMVIWDEIESNYNFEQLLGLLDRHPKRNESKDGHIEFNIKMIIITSNLYPTAIFNHVCEEQKLALLGRINILLECNGPIYEALI